MEKICYKKIYKQVFGFFQTDEDKKKFSNTKQLIDDLGLYIGNIFFSYHEDLYHLRITQSKEELISKIKEQM